MKHYFDIEIAAKYGMLEAVLLENIHYWIEKNKMEGRNLHDGKYWMYNSVKKFAELFPYASEKKIRSAIKLLREEGILEVGNYNQHKMDKTLWYALTEKGNALFEAGKNDADSSCDVTTTENSNVVDSVDNFEYKLAEDTAMTNSDGKIEHSIVPKWEYDMSKKANRNAQGGKAIPYINTNNNTDIKSNIDPYVSYTFIYNDKTMDLMRIAEGRTYSAREKVVDAEYKESVGNGNNNSYKRPSYETRSRSNSSNQAYNKYGTTNKFCQFEQHQYSKADFDMIERAILRNQQRMLC